jgi:hypothetical protein
LYNAIYYNSEIVTNAIANTDPKVLKIFDISKDKFTTINGYFIFIVKVIEIIFSLYALKIGIQMASYDKKTNTRDFLYTKPKKRNTTIINRIISKDFVLIGSSYRLSYQVREAIWSSGSNRLSLIFLRAGEFP